MLTNNVNRFGYVVNPIKIMVVEFVLSLLLAVSGIAIIIGIYQGFRVLGIWYPDVLTITTLLVLTTILLGSVNKNYIR